MLDTLCFWLVQTVPKLNLGRYEFQKMGRIGSTEMYLIWKRFGPTIISAGLITASFYCELQWLQLQGLAGNKL